MLLEFFIACNIRYVFLSFDSIKTIIIIIIIYVKFTMFTQYATKIDLFQDLKRPKIRPCQENDTRSGRRFACRLYPSNGPLQFITGHSRFALASAMRKRRRRL